MFWTIAAALLFAAALITFSPLLGARTLWKPLGLALVFVLPASALWMYQQFGTPEALDYHPQAQAKAQQAATNEAHTSESAEMDAMVDGLRRRLTETPEDLDGWLLLARTLKTMGRFPEAIGALETASRIAPEDPRVLVDLVEDEIFMTPDGRISDDMIATLEHVLNVQPGQQKALWLMGIAASQKGQNEIAIAYWEDLLEQLEPGSPVAESVQGQINDALGLTGVAAEEPAPAAPVDDGSWQGLGVTVRAGETGQSQIPSGGVLYLMIRSPGPAMGPPIGVRRVIDPLLPLDLRISDQDSMLKERQISTEAEIQLQARISLSGSPAASPGDWQSGLISVPVDSAETVELVIDQRVE